MGKCPLCGSPGDDLVFRFYCSNRDCENHVPEERPGKCGEDPDIPDSGDSFRFGWPGSIGPLPPREDIEFDSDHDSELKMSSGGFGCLRQRILEGLRASRESLGEPGYGSRLHELGDMPYPKFQLVMDPIERGLFLAWVDKVPSVLNMFVEPIMEGRIGEPMTERATLATRGEVIRCLLSMRSRGELVWNPHGDRWELHFTE